MVEWLGSGLQSRVRGFESRPHLATKQLFCERDWRSGARFPDTEEVTGSIPVSPTSKSDLMIRLFCFSCSRRLPAGAFSVYILLASGVSRGAVSCLHIVGLRVVTVDLERACSVA